jgi:hypothetical protein
LIEHLEYTLECPHCKKSFCFTTDKGGLCKMKCPHCHKRNQVRVQEINPKPIKEVSSTAGIDPLPHYNWAIRVARKLRKQWGFVYQSHEEADIEGKALEVMIECAKIFDPARVPSTGRIKEAFEGFAHPFVVGACRRQAIQLRNGGTYLSRRENEHDRPVIVEHMSARLTPSGEQIELIDPKSMR